MYIHTLFHCLCHGLWLTQMVGFSDWLLSPLILFQWVSTTWIVFPSCLHVMFNIDCLLGTIRSLVSAECCSSLTSTTTSACPLWISRSTTLTKAWSTRSLRHISTSSEFLPYHNHIYSIYSYSNPNIINNVHLLSCQNYRNERFF